MAYNRPYSLQEVVEILDASEHRIKPGSRSPKDKGHAIRLHTQERQDKFSRPKRKGQKKDDDTSHLPEADSTFLVDRNCLAGMVHEALNSSSGQNELEKLHGEERYVQFQTYILRQGENFDIFTVYRPKEGQTSVDWASATAGDGYIIRIFIQVYKILDSGEESIHIQTAYAKDFARTGDGLHIQLSFGF